MIPFLPLLSANKYFVIPFLENKKVPGPLLENKKVQGAFLFMFFDRSEIQIQAFLLFINRKFITFQSSSPQHYLNKYILENYIYIYIYIYIYKKYFLKTECSITGPENQKIMVFFSFGPLT